MKKTKKSVGRVYTPPHVVVNILNLCGYNGTKILGKHIIDNSCGDGAFLIQVVKRYCDAAKLDGLSCDQISRDLEKYIHGIDIDLNETEKCRKNLDIAAAQYGIINVNWDIICGNSLSIKHFDGKMDFVVGNPPYVRVHNLDENYAAVKQYNFAQGGMTDLYIVFYEVGLKMLALNGVLGYISPSSWFNSLAGSIMRKHLYTQKNIHTIVDLKHYQPFSEATTYTAIAILTACQNNHVKYYEYGEESLTPHYITELEYEDIATKNSFVFEKREALVTLKTVKEYAAINPVFTVKNGFATLFDGFFIGDWDFESYTIPAVKASTGKATKCIFPYDNNGNILPYETLTQNADVKKHYEQHTEKLKKRALGKDAPWHGFGRSQGIKDVYKQKYAINTLIRNVADIKLHPCPLGTGVYSGLYILTKLDFAVLQDMLLTDDFVDYIAMLGKYKSGGYYTFSSKDLSQYLNYKYTERNGFKNEQHTIS